jgi:hypothetical protein
MVYSHYEQDIAGKGTGITRSNVSITLHLFFLRIMKEHCIFLEAGFSAKDEFLAGQAREFQKGFESLLMQASQLCSNVVSKKALESQQFVTPYTVQAERLTSFFTGIPINSEITEREKAIVPWEGVPVPAKAYEAVLELNESARRLTKQLADFKKKILSDVKRCRISTANYLDELDHMVDEAEHYIKNLDRIERIENPIYHGNLAEELEFWNEIMADHNKAAAGRLDPAEKSLIEKSLAFAKEFEGLSDESKKLPDSKSQAKDKNLEAQKSLEAVKRLQVFQTESVKGLMDCSIHAILYPLRMDHHIRETAHFEFILEAIHKPHV